jgi:2-phospho-L-lactate/phosphoenolpyruvate guanylyltransferase
MPDVSTPAERWAIVVPVKRFAVAKTRLSPDPRARADLALAMALDTVAAATACTAVSLVVVVTDEPLAVDALRRTDAHVVADGPDAGLNPALTHGAKEAVARDPGAHVAALASDLPALRADALDVVLRAASMHRSTLVADAAGVGTTLLTAVDLAAFVPRFGPGSRAAHVAAGTVDMTEGTDASVRRDVDTVDDLRDAVRLGCGPATVRALQRRPLLE